MRWLALVAVAIGVSAPAASESTARLADSIEAVAQSNRAIRGAFWGISVVELESGNRVYTRNANSYFVPASNAKLFSTALALDRLGPEHRFVTRVMADSEPTGEGVIEGDLRFVGGGDPTLSARRYPYKKGRVLGDPLAPIRTLAEILVERGVSRVEGSVVGDDRAYVWEPYPNGWSVEDLQWEYGAPVSALSLHDNMLRLSILPGRRTGEPGRLVLRPEVEYYPIHNHVDTVAQGTTRVWVDWPALSKEITVWGKIKPRDGRAKLLAIRDPAHYAAWILSDNLRQRGVVIDGQPRALHRHMHEVEDFKQAEEPLPLAGVTLAERQSPPLFEILQVVNKVSQNLHAELVLREVGRVRRNIGTRAAAFAEMKAFLAEAGVAAREYEIDDASGLSRLNLVTPAATTKLLRHMYLSKERDGWIETLPSGGEDGTLSYRFRGASSAGRVQAKTGTLSHVSGLSGYADSDTLGALAFSIYVNNYVASDSAVRSFMDQVVQRLLE